MSDTERQQKISQGVIDGLKFMEKLGKICGSAIAELDAGLGLSPAAAERLIELLDCEQIVAERM